MVFVCRQHERNRSVTFLKVRECADEGREQSADWKATGIARSLSPFPDVA